MASGSGGKMAVVSVSSLYSVIADANVAAGMWTNFVSESLEHTIGNIQEGSITGYKDAPPSYAGVSAGAGDIQFEPNPNAIGAFLRASFGQSSGTVLTIAGSWGANSGGILNLPAGQTSARPVVQHLFTPIQTAASDRSFLPNYGVVVYKDVGSAFLFSGGVINAIEFNVQAGQLAKATASGMFRQVSRIGNTNSFQAQKTSGGRPWVWDMASVQVGPGVNSFVAKTNYEAITIKLETPMEGVSLLDGTKLYGEYQVNGFRNVAIQGTMSFRDQTEYDAFIAYEASYLRLTMTHVISSQIIGNPSSANYFTLQLDVPQMKYLTWSTPVGGPNRLVSQFTARAEFDTTSLYMIEARLTNTVSAYL